MVKKHGMKTATSYVPLGTCTEKPDCEWCLKGNEPKLKWMWVAYVNTEVKVLDVGPMVGDGICQSAIDNNLSEFNNAIFSIINKEIYFNTVESGKVGISYMGVVLDEDGWPMIKSTHVKAVSSYLIYMYKYRDYLSGNVPDYVVTRLDRDWHWECGQARGDDEMPDASELKYLVNQHMQMLPLPSKNNF